MGVTHGDRRRVNCEETKERSLLNTHTHTHGTGEEEDGNSKRCREEGGKQTDRCPGSQTHRHVPRQAPEELPEWGQIHPGQVDDLSHGKGHVLPQTHTPGPSPSEWVL